MDEKTDSEIPTMVQNCLAHSKQLAHLREAVPACQRCEVDFNNERSAVNHEIFGTMGAATCMIEALRKHSHVDHSGIKYVVVEDDELQRLRDICSGLMKFTRDRGV